MAENNTVDKSREYLTYLVVVPSLGGIIVLSIVVLWWAKDPLETAKFVFGAVLPLLGTWIGTILAFYFSKENFQAANQAVTAMARSVTALDRLKSIPVNAKMRPLDSIRYQTVKPGDESNIKLLDLVKFFDGYERMLSSARISRSVT